jgi:hypothetical protein
MLKAMRSHFIHSERWQSQNERLQEQLSRKYGFAAGASVRVFPHYEQAVLELVQGTCLFYAHKRSLGLQLGASSLISHFHKVFLREGLQVQSLDCESLHGEGLEKWLQEVKKDTNFCLLQADHSVLDQIFATEEFEKKCEDKKILCFILHHQSLNQKIFMQPDFLKSIRPYSVHIFYADQNIEQDLCVAICGERFKTPTLVADQIGSTRFDLQNQQFVNAIQSADSPIPSIKSIQATIESLEKQYPHPFQKEFPRQFRQIMLGTKRSSDFVYRELIQINSVWKNSMVSPNLCLQELNSAQFQWWKPHPDLQSLNNLLIVSAQISGDEQFWSHLAAIDAKQTVNEFEVKLG